jgi:hypothetical protein
MKACWAIARMWYLKKKQNIFNPLASNNVERIRDHPCPLITAPILTRGLQASPAQRWIAAI